MTRLKRSALLALIAVLALYSCGLDGGSRGTGITSFAQGNVASVNMSTSALEGITVTVENRGAQGVTSSKGLFLVSGIFEGRLDLLFTRSKDAIRAHTVINLPAGGTLTLNNVRIDNAHGVATPDSEDVDFDAQIIRIDCPAQNLFVVASQHAPTDTDSYVLRLDTSSLRDPKGHPISCAQLRDGQMADVQGTVNTDGSFGHALIVVTP